MGVVRATFYRWKKDNKEFREAVNKALAEGRENVTEICEVMILKKIREGDPAMIKFWLVNNSEKYAARRPMPPPPSINEEMRRMLLDAMHTIKGNRPLTKEAQANIDRALRMAGYIDEEGQITNRFKDDFSELIAEEEELEKERKKI